MTPRRITYEVRDGGPAPDVGDVLESTRSLYFVTESRAVSTRDGARRFSLVVIRYPLEERDTRSYSRWFSLKWDKRTRKRPRGGAGKNTWVHP